MRQGFLLTFSLLLIITLKSPLFAQDAPSYPDADADSIAAPQDQSPLTKEQIEGTVESIHGETATIRAESGERVDVDLGPRSFWRERGYHLAVGIPVQVEAWHRTDIDGPYFAGGIWGPGFVIELTDDQGFPLWVNAGEYWPGWYPTEAYFDVYFFRPPLYMVGPGPRWYFGPYYHRGPYVAGRHYYSRPYFGRHYAGRPYGGGGPHDGGQPRSGRRGH
ncbi:MAG TPA: hypothetical protein VGL38_09060 [bacterium]|jgi:hypothetical protein